MDDGIQAGPDDMMTIGGLQEVVVIAYGTRLGLGGGRFCLLLLSVFHSTRWGQGIGPIDKGGQERRLS